MSAQEVRRNLLCDSLNFCGKYCSRYISDWSDMKKQSVWSSYLSCLGQAFWPQPLVSRWSRWIGRCDPQAWETLRLSGLETPATQKPGQTNNLDSPARRRKYSVQKQSSKSIHYNQEPTLRAVKTLTVATLVGVAGCFDNKDWGEIKSHSKWLNSNSKLV